eukprot:TRINITY_DN55150_c0_g1_i1.p1 TRINITY_DN55150_c0_g1~~TRINITY_DN55150_c0_g1_i1.p1  ORF type:complete len:362 (+),score=48.76 TRINITY_DN55150_c0_g1_i1:117-1088(+)
MVSQQSSIEAKIEDHLLALHSFCTDALPFRQSNYIQELLRKLAAEGVREPRDLGDIHPNMLQTKLAKRAHFSVVELADSVRLCRLASGEESRSVDRQLHRSMPYGKERGVERIHEGENQRVKGGPSAAQGPSRGRDGRDKIADFGGHNRDSTNSNRKHFRSCGSAAAISSALISSEGTPRSLEKPQIWAAAERGDAQVVALLLQGKADVNVRHRGWTPCMKAAEENQANVLKLLLHNRADIEACNQKGRTALSFAAAPSMGRETASVALEVLINMGADLMAKDHRGRTAKDRAREEGRDESVAFLEKAESIGACTIDNRCSPP